MWLWVWAAWTASALAAGCDKGGAPGEADPAAIVTGSSTPTTNENFGAPISSGRGEGCDDLSAKDCPLRRWMQRNSSLAMRSGNLETLAGTLEKVATFAPQSPGYPNWFSIALDGAAAARAASMEGVRASCRGCHDQYKALYKAQLRARPLP